ncbi:DUF559 domain-containing protein [Caldithrix abyssi]|uniref:Histidinol dehydrogenase/leucyl-tRNA synthetase n=1 Tax=Caldithrix abyssi DSM 13497 TaxID=880073 RepID=A0A1J1CB24_CALAY|nr:histidinol dehydrogenase/leucyl-tRNA synthetase [Caldithrix abyssi DSM 13497]
MVIEIDGGVHLRQKEYDQIRTEIMELKGLKVLRFKNEEVEENLGLVIKKIKEYLK